MNDDTISRQAALDAIDRLILPQVKGETAAEEINRVAWRCAINCAEEMIVHLPSAERRGRWIEEYSANHFQAKCSACGESTLYGITYDLEGNAYYMNYCPNCGAKMEGEQNG